jgi:hypothetical protein
MSIPNSIRSFHDCCSLEGNSPKTHQGREDDGTPVVTYGKMSRIRDRGGKIQSLYMGMSYLV